MATPKRLSPGEQWVLEQNRPLAEAVETIEQADSKIEKAKARHARELEQLEGERFEALVQAVMKVGAKAARTIPGVTSIPAAVTAEAKRRIEAAKEAARERAHPAPKFNPEPTAAGGPESGGAAEGEAVPGSPEVEVAAVPESAGTD
jgi:hypothetical protein